SDQEAVQKALEKLGPAAEKNVLKYMNHPDNRLSERARALLKSFGTKEAVLLPQCVADLARDEKGTRNKAADWLSKATPVDSHRAAVRATANAMLTDADAAAREGGVRLLQTWGTDKDSFAGLSQAINDRSVKVAGPALDMLIALKDRRAAEPLVEKMAARGFKDRAKVADALIAMGAPAEKPVQRLLASGERGIRAEGCELLKASGTADSIDPLKKAAADRLLKAQAEDAIKAIQARK